MVQVAWAVAQLIAPFLGALLLESVGLAGVVLLDVLSFVCAVLVLLAVSRCMTGLQARTYA
jgi:hypothetical protein